jgi:hypothetical protein
MANTDPLNSAELAELLGPPAAGWPELGLTVTRGTADDPDLATEVTVRHNGEIIGFTEQSQQFPGRRTYLAVITAGSRGVPFPAGFIPDDPLRAQLGERWRWLPEGHPDRPTKWTNPAQNPR